MIEGDCAAKGCRGPEPFYERLGSSALGSSVCGEWSCHMLSPRWTTAGFLLRRHETEKGLKNSNGGLEQQYATGHALRAAASGTDAQRVSSCPLPRSPTHAQTGTQALLSVSSSKRCPTVARLIVTGARFQDALASPANCLSLPSLCRLGTVSARRPASAPPAKSQILHQQPPLFTLQEETTAAGLTACSHESSSLSTSLLLATLLCIMQRSSQADE
jgi:hypothetical protein